MLKIVTFAPIKDAEKVRTAMGDAGAGMWRNYHHTSFSTRGIGRFIPGKGAQPAIGKVGKLEEVEEERIKAIHPYEEVLVEIYQLLSEDEID